MMERKKYITPRIKKVVILAEGYDILAGSVVDKADVTSTGQEVIDLDFSDDSFNHNWERE